MSETYFTRLRLAGLSTVCVSLLSLTACGGGTDSPPPSNLNPGVVLGAAVVDWDAPTLREDGSSSVNPVTDLQAYRILFGTVSGVYTDDILVDKDVFPLQFANTQFEITNVPVGDYFYVVTAIDIDGRESPYSLQDTATVN